MERRPALLVLLLAFGLLGLVAAREARFRQEVRGHAVALAEAVSLQQSGHGLDSAQLGRLAAPMGFVEASVNGSSHALDWHQTEPGFWDHWPVYHLELPLGVGRVMRVGMAASHWFWHLGWLTLLLAGAWGLSALQRAWEQERQGQRVRLDRAASAEAGALQRLQRRLDLERKVASLQAQLRGAKAADRDRAIEAVLRELGQSAGSDRCVLFQFMDGGQRFGITHAWSAEGLRDGGMEGFDSLPTDAFPWWRDRMRAGELVHAAGLETMPTEAGAERYLLELRGTKAYMMAPVVLANDLLGFAGYVRVREARPFGVADQDLLLESCGALAEFLVRAKGELRSTRLARLERCNAIMAAQLLEAGADQAMEAYRRTLAELAAFVGAERAGLWVLQSDGGRVRLHSEWTSAAAPATQPRDTEMASAGLPQLMAQLRSGKAWKVAGVERLDSTWDAERIELRRRGIVSAVLHGIYAGGHLLGWLQVERLSLQALADESEIACATAASIFASALKRERAEAALRASEDRARALLSGVPDALVRINAQGRVLDARLPKGERSPLAELLGQDLDRLPKVLLGLAPGSVPALRAALANALRTERAQTLDLRMDEREGTRYLEWRLVPQQGQEVLAVVRDRSKERRQELEHERQLGNLLAIFNAGRRGLMLLGMDGRVQAFNEAADQSSFRDLGVHLQAGMDLGLVAAPEAGPIIGELMRRAAEGHEPVIEQEFPLPGGRHRLMRIQCLPVFGEGGEVRAICMSMDYLDDVAEAREALRVSEERYALAALGSKDGLWDLDLRSGVLYVSPRLENMLGLGEGEGPTSMDAWVALAHPDDRDSFKARLQAHLEGRTDHFEAELRLRHAALTDPVWMLVRGMAVRGTDKKAVRVAGSQTDIHLRKLTETSLLRDALHDPLTGLPNRAVLLDRLGRCQARGKRRKGYHYALLYLDTDDFKTVNQSLGTQVGDRLLKELAQRLEQCLRPGDTVGRLGGDEFALILDDLAGPKDAEVVADRVMEFCRQPIMVEGRPLYLSASIGIALSGEEAPSAADMLRDAETAMVQAKAGGRSNWRLFEPSMLKAAVSRLDLDSGLRQALEEGQFRLHYQPIVDMQSGKLAGVEALARWQHPTRGMIMPSEFIPAAEESGLILPLGRLILKEALRQMHAWSVAGAPPDLGMSVNLSPRQLEDPELLPTLETALRETPINVSALQLEVTESVFMSNRQAAAQVLEQLTALGPRIAIDDFGTGYASLSYLHQLPAHVLKIDRSFVSRMDGLPENEAVTSAVITLGHKLGLKLVAEGIETTLQAGRLRALGCGFGQGYLFAKPLPPEAIPALWRKPFDLPPPLEEGGEKGLN